MNKKLLFIFGLLALLLAAGAVFWYGSSQKKTGNAAPDVKVIEVPAAKNSLAGLPDGFPPEILASLETDKATVESRGNQTTVILMSKLAPGELLGKFIASVEAKGWKVLSQYKDATSAQALALYQKKNITSGSAEFRATKMSGVYTEVYIKYLK